MPDAPDQQESVTESFERDMRTYQHTIDRLDGPGVHTADS